MILIENWFIVRRCGKGDVFFINECGKKNAETVAQALFYLIAHRCAKPDSIRGSALEQSSFAGLSPLGLDVFYNVLDVLAEQKEAIIAHLCTFFEKKTERKSPDTYLDVTTYAFESTRWGELRMFGFSKDRKNNGIQVVMALLLDNNGIPITYELFPGNAMDQNTLKQTIEKLKTIDEEKIKQAERFDGYYAIATNNLSLSTEQVCQAYRGIWKIEESFRVLKHGFLEYPHTQISAQKLSLLSAY